MYRQKIGIHYGYQAFSGECPQKDSTTRQVDLYEVSCTVLYLLYLLYMGCRLPVANPAQ
ncbi:hypothetical protein NSMM_500003 [Nitrosomonas mobilis]|uniref:Uncharacterized protein n=2 Tax=Nitrosomonas mobilis TaxID=51642 RepID=A0A1G5SG77_9PROT|nr:hypothetical protein NSMM_500003 [Nitrosomonas mobilis]